MIAEHLVKSPSERRRPPSKHPESSECGLKNENLFSPRFRSVAAMAGWDEEALLIASRIVEDTPDRQMKQRKLAVESDVRNLKTTPPPDSTRKIKVHRTNPVSIPVTVLDLEENDSKPEPEQQAKGADAEGSTATPIPCIDRLREELSCAICLEICYEPSTTSCGHSFCKKCLISAADKCGKRCPKCRHLISNGRHCTVNTVLWNTIQLLFPQEIGARKAAANGPESGGQSPVRTRNRSIRALDSPGSDRSGNHRVRSRSSRRRPSSSGGGMLRREADLPSQDEDAALALRLQREEFMEVFRVRERRSSSLAVARANLRAMASRATTIRLRGRQT